MNKIYVVVSEMDFIDDSNYEVEKAFINEEDAKNYCKEMNAKTDDCLTFTYKEIEVC